MNIAGNFSVTCKEYKGQDPKSEQNDLNTQLVISLVVGLLAFISFCLLRPRWKSLYAARKRQKDAASSLPELPDTFLGWIPVLYRISEEEVLESAGLDAFVFLTFFKMATKFLSITFFLALVVINPVHKHFNVPGIPKNSTQPEVLDTPRDSPPIWALEAVSANSFNSDEFEGNHNFLWMHVIFVYVFTGLAIYLLVVETKKIIRVRQEYLGGRISITDRTFRVSGIPLELRNEEKLKALVEKLEIGKVEEIHLCRNWKELDQLMVRRASALRKLEEAWAQYVGREAVKSDFKLRSTNPTSRSNHNDDADSETSHLLNPGSDDQYHPAAENQQRPKNRIWYGFLNLQSRSVDSIDYYEEMCRRLDEEIEIVRKKEFPPTPLAFVTMNSFAAAQMAVQAILDPVPMHLLARLAPAPPDVVWSNTYMSRHNRMLRTWSITLFIIVLTILWTVPVVSLAGLIDLCSIHKVWPGLAEMLSRNEIGRSLVQTGLPTLILSLLNLAVPFLYDWLSNMQGMISQDDVELSVISKNFFFTFFNVFVIFTVSGTSFTVFGLFDSLQKDTSQLAMLLAHSLEDLSQFYVNLIVLQGLGLLPLRLLEFGSVALYPFGLIGAKTPRDFADLKAPPLFKYGFYLPQTILILILCIVYSVFPDGYLVLLFGLIYFLIGHLTYKYQLLYAMDHSPHSTGRVWPMICYRLMLGLGVFQLSMAGWLALRQALKRALMLAPLIVATVWFSYFFARTYEPLTKYIALRSIHVAPGRGEAAAGTDGAADAHAHAGVYVPGRIETLETEERMRFVNPNLSAPLEAARLSGGRRLASDSATANSEGSV
ncbi:MAG: hypothetical protein M1829_003421 [Trizodia sp. TS-e1964]|nr:MAG: hypothetical protein M1829_003421 [Trizodia sp. TS-e1964]